MKKQAKRPVVYVIAGPNGAGKTTFAMDYLLNEVHCEEFVNADMIASGLSPFNEEAAAITAGRLFLERIHLIKRRFKKGITNLFSVYKAVCDSIFILDNSSTTPEPVAVLYKGEIEILVPSTWNQILGMTQ